MKRVLQIRLLIIIGISIIVLGSSTQVQSQNHNSNSELSGYWSDASSWSGGSIAPTTSSTQNLNIQINGYIIRGGNLAYTGNNANLTVQSGDTLVVDGNLSLKNGSKVTIESGGILVVLGDFTTKNNLDLSTNGNLVVIGEFEIGNSGNVNNNGNIYLYDDTPTTGNSNINGGFEDETDLENNNEDLFKFVENNGTLPVELIEFSIVPKNESALLSWSTATEINNEKFEIERTVDGNSFEYVGEVEGNGTTNVRQDYTFTDHQPINGTTYYRLKQIDFDGVFEYLPIAKLELALSNALFDATPNVIQNQNITISIANMGHGTGIIKVFSLKGEEVYHESKELTMHATSKFELSGTSQLRGGIYIITLESGTNVYKRKVIVNNPQ